MESDAIVACPVIIDADKAQASTLLHWAPHSGGAGVHHSHPQFQLPLGSYMDSPKISSIYTIIPHKCMRVTILV